MPIYTYESVETGERFDFTQKMDEPRYTSHPESGEEMIRVIVAGFSIRYNGIREHVKVNKKLPAATLSAKNGGGCGIVSGEFDVSILKSMRKAIGTKNAAPQAITFLRDPIQR